jgi:hypothetical protein
MVYGTYNATDSAYYRAVSPPEPAPALSQNRSEANAAPSVPTTSLNAPASQLASAFSASFVAIELLRNATGQLNIAA